MDLDTDEKLLAFLQEELKQRAVIAFCESSFLDFARGWQLFMFVDVGISTYTCRRLDEKCQGSYRLILADDDMLLSRGIDFRGNQNGLTFVEAKKARDPRTLQQLAYRVGRMGEFCRRVRVQGMEQVDQAKNLAYRTKLLAFLNKQQMQKVKKETKAAQTKMIKTKKEGQKDGTKLLGVRAASQMKLDQMLTASNLSDKKSKVD